ncbi:hypothetical protein IG631_00568 [Alternaria alternata]|nr:hypothetical protein IG631_00568 [Alternaria alternata]
MVRVNQAAANWANLWPRIVVEVVIGPSQRVNLEIELKILLNTAANHQSNDMAHFILTPKWLGTPRATRAATARESTAPQQTESESKENDEEMEHDPTDYTSDSSEDKSSSNAEPETPASDNGEDGTTGHALPRERHSPVRANDGIKVIWKHVADKATSLATQAKYAVTEAVKKVKELGFIGTAKAIGEWIKLHPWETALIVVPLVALIVTAIALSATGFGPAGIVAGRSQRDVGCKEKTLMFRRQYSSDHPCGHRQRRRRIDLCDLHQRHDGRIWSSGSVWRSMARINSLHG